MKIKIVDTGVDRSLTKGEMKKLESMCSSIEKRIRTNRKVTMEVEVIFNTVSRFNGQHLGGNRFVLWVPGRGVSKWNLTNLRSLILHELGHWDCDLKGLVLSPLDEEKYATKFAKRHLLAGEKFTM